MANGTRDEDLRRYVERVGRSRSQCEGPWGWCKGAVIGSRGNLKRT